MFYPVIFPLSQQWPLNIDNYNISIIPDVYEMFILWLPWFINIYLNNVAFKQDNTLTVLWMGFEKFTWFNPAIFWCLFWSKNLELQYHITSPFFVFNGLRWEVVDRFVDGHFLNFLFHNQCSTCTLIDLLHISDFDSKMIPCVAKRLERSLIHIFS